MYSMVDQVFLKQVLPTEDLHRSGCFPRGTVSPGEPMPEQVVAKLRRPPLSVFHPEINPSVLNHHDLV